MLATTFISLVVGVVQVGPNTCRVDLLNPNNTIHSFETKCEYISPEHVVVPYRAPYGP